MFPTHGTVKICPRCKTENESGWDYGDLLVPDIPTQTYDTRHNIQREYKARRCYCGKCNYMWDVVLVNRVITEKAE